MIEINLKNANLEPSDEEQIQRLLDIQDPNISDNVEQIWHIIDKVWDEMGCDNKKLNWEQIGKFYAHPVWVLNGLFVEWDELSYKHKTSLAKYAAKRGHKNMCDYGGGFGTLAREIAKYQRENLDANSAKEPKASSHTQAQALAPIDIFEPFPSVYGKRAVAGFENVAFIDSMKGRQYECILCMDVLEHVDDVLGSFAEIVNALEMGGELLVGNCFYPVIKCHLPKNFHYRYTFKHFARAFGLRYNGVISGAEYVQSFTKIKDSKYAKNPNSIMLRMGGGGGAEPFIA